jgi:hypothetical protein
MLVYEELKMRVDFSLCLLRLNSPRHYAEEKAQHLPHLTLVNRRREYRWVATRTCQPPPRLEFTRVPVVPTPTPNVPFAVGYLVRNLSVGLSSSWVKDR